MIMIMMMMMMIVIIITKRESDTLRDATDNPQFT